MDIQDYAQELLATAKEYKQYAFEYKKERAAHSDALNKLIVLLEKTGLSGDKASFENKLPKLLCTDAREDAQRLIFELNSSRANYKGWEHVLEAYKAHISAIQSVIKYNLQGELNQNVVERLETEKYF